MDYLAIALVAAAVAYGLLHVLRRRRERFMEDWETRFVPLTDDPSDGFVCIHNSDGTGRSIIRRVKSEKD